MTDDKEKGNLVFHERTEMIFKIIVIGDPAVGKTSLLTNFCGDKFTYEYIPTVGVNITKEPVTIKDDMGKDITVNLMVWDIAGQQRFDVFRTMFFRGAKAAFLVFDLTRPITLTKLQDWHEDLIRNAGKDVLTFLVGNKNDLEDLRSIPKKDALAFAKKINALAYIETSAKTGTNVNESFTSLTKNLVEKAKTY